MTTNGIREKINSKQIGLIIQIVFIIVTLAVAWTVIREQVKGNTALAQDNKKKIDVACTALAVETEKVTTVRKKQDEYTQDIKRIASLQARQTAETEHLKSDVQEIKSLIKELSRRMP